MILVKMVKGENAVCILKHSPVSIAGSLEAWVRYQDSSRLSLYPRSCVCPGVVLDVDFSSRVVFQNHFVCI